MRMGYKSYWRLPFGLGEVQYGHLTGRITLWFRGRMYRVIRAEVERLCVADGPTVRWFQEICPDREGIRLKKINLWICGIMWSIEPSAWAVIAWFRGWDGMVHVRGYGRAR